MSADREAAFRDFVLDRYPSLVRLAYLLLGDRGLAEDLAQTALVRVYGTWGAIREPASADAYTRKTMMRLAYRWRGRAWRAEIPAGLEAAETATHTAEDDAIVMRQALGRLPVHQREVLVARFYLDLTEAQTADLLGCSVGTVKSRASRAMAALRADGLLGNEVDRHG